MSALRNYLNKIKPNFEPEGKLHAFRSIFDGFETFLYVPNTTAKTGVNIHDAIDSKRIMSMVVIALMPAMLFGMYNIGYQNYLAAKERWLPLRSSRFSVMASLPYFPRFSSAISLAWALSSLGRNGKGRRYRKVTLSVVS